MANNSEVIRTFIAVDLPETAKRDLEKLQHFLMKDIRGIRWVKPEGIHLTLKFFGDVEIGRIPEIEQAIGEVVRDYRPFMLTPKGCGAFPTLKNIRVIWAGLDGDVDVLCELQRKLEEQLELIGFPREDRSFKPHLTLGRAKSISRGDNPGKALLKALEFQSTPFWVDEIVIFKSNLTPSGAIYKKISSVKLFRL